MPKLEQTVFVVDDDAAVRDALSMLFRAAGLKVETFPSAGSFLQNYRLELGGCLVLDIRMPGMSGLALQKELSSRRLDIPVVFLTGHADVPMAVRAMKDGAFDFIEKPIDSPRLIPVVLAALKHDMARRSGTPVADKLTVTSNPRLADLTEREREILDLVLEGRQTKAIAESLGVTIKTVEFHRSRIREKLGVSSLAELFRLFLR
ncbi:MAG TPA: response regulator [Noviherbaspirillum sp.]|jgi:FixJ family two-component response regulator|uniref:response regulator transcription factor n=1 Tax=Noviherbaspirillum sp. TaxID=1926288 RepID=UPI002DDCE0E8|nr:response regulator [Noviherbaspirillum sp.]HEV2609988.1 response regulator [Noviherbaspirillum sp.]